MRWARNVKDRRGAQYAGLVVTFGLAWAILAVLVVPTTWWTWTALAITALARLAAAWIVGSSVLRDRQVVRDLILIPHRDAVALGVWLASFFGNTVTWRGQHFRLHDGRLSPIK